MDATPSKPLKMSSDAFNVKSFDHQIYEQDAANF
jgi:hypothetical protein